MAGRYHQRILFVFALFLVLLFAGLALLGCAGLTWINRERIDVIMKSVRIMSGLNELRSSFSRQHNAITYGLSKSAAAAQETYLSAQERIQKSLTGLTAELSDRKDLVLLNNLTYAQTMFSDQIIRLFDYLNKRKSLSLTYDELTDLKSYPVKALTDANGYAEQFQSALGGLEENTLRIFNAELDFIVTVFRRGIFYLAVILGGVLLLLLIALGFYSAAAARPFRKISESLKAMTGSDFSIMPDYGVVEDENVRFVLKSIGQTISHFRNFLNAVGTDLQSLTETLRSFPATLESISSLETEAREASRENRKILLRYAQEMENAQFHFDRVIRAVDILDRERDNLLTSVEPARGLLDGTITSNRLLTDTLYRFNGTAEKINLFALNITLEAARENEPKGYSELASEIRALIGQGVEAHHQIIKLMNDNLNSFASVRQTLHGAEKAFEGMASGLREMKAENSRLEEIKKSGFEAEAAVEENNARIEESAVRAKELLDRLGQTGHKAGEIMRRIEKEVRGFGSLKNSLTRDRRKDDHAGVLITSSQE